MNTYIELDLSLKLTAQLVTLQNAILQQIANELSNYGDLHKVTKKIISEKVSLLISIIDKKGRFNAHSDCFTPHKDDSGPLIQYRHPNGSLYFSLDDFIQQHALEIAQTFTSFYKPPIVANPVSYITVDSQIPEKQFLDLINKLDEIFKRNIYNNNETVKEFRKFLNNNRILLDYLSGLPINVTTANGEIKQKRISAAGFEKFTRTALQFRILSNSISSRISNIPPQMDLIPFLSEAKNCRVLIKVLIREINNVCEDYLYINLIKFAELKKDNLEHLKAAIDLCESLSNNSANAKKLINRLKTFIQQTEQARNVASQVTINSSVTIPHSVRPVQNATITQTAPAAEGTQVPANSSVSTTLLPSFSVFCSSLPEESEAIPDEPPTKKRRTVGPAITDAAQALIALNQSPVFNAVNKANENGPLPSVKQILQGSLTPTQSS